MIDFETFGNGKNACVVQIGACYFNRETGETGEYFKSNIDARSAIASGADMDADTIYWWLSQSPDAIKSVTEIPLIEIKDAFESLNAFLALAEGVRIWSHATFDFVILTETLKRLKMKPRFSYRAARDIRTLLDLSGVDFKKVPREGLHHDALDDCFHQIKYCVEAFKSLKNEGAET